MNLRGDAAAGASAEPRNDDETNRLVDAVAALQTELNRADRASAAALGVGSAEDLQVLRLLLADGAQRVGEVARRRGSSITTASGRLDRLERKGLVRRDRIPGDRRAMVVTLTEAGTEAAARSRRHRIDSLGPVAEGFPFDVFDHLIRAVADDAADGQPS